MINSTPVLPDEDTFEMPRSWRRHLHPRRGGWPGPKITLDATGEGELLARYSRRIGAALDHPETEPELAAAGREHLAGRPVPLGAAAVAAVPDAEYHKGDTAVRFVDAWIATYGLPFAVHAFLERCAVEVRTHAAGKDVLSWYPGTGYDDHRLEDAAKRLRALLAVADDTEYREVVTLLSGLRSTPGRQMISAYLVPTEAHWVAECCAAPPNSVPRDLLLRSLGSTEHLDILGSGAGIGAADCHRLDNLVTLAEGVGPEIAPLLAEAFADFRHDATRRVNLLEVLGRLPGDEAFRLMLEAVDDPHMGAALRETMERSPVRALRVLAAEPEENAAARDLLTDHLLANAGLVARVLPQLPATSRATVERLIKNGERAPEATADELPRLLADPPWTRTPQKPVVVKGLTAPTGQSVVWDDGMREEWLRTEIFHPYPESWHLSRDERGYGDVGTVPAPQERAERWDRWITHFQAGRVDEDEEWIAGLLAMGPEELVRPALREWEPDEWNDSGGWWSPEAWLKVLIARFELDALPVTLRFARAKPARGAELLMPFLDGEVAVAMAGRLLHARSLRDVATAWFERNGRAALPYLVPVALGRAGKARTAAEYALLFLARREGSEAVLDAARAHGDQAAEPVETLLTNSPEDYRPRRRIPSDLGVRPELLPQVLLKGRERALPMAAVRHLLTLLAISTPEDPDPGLAGVLEACDARSLAQFGLELRGQWVKRGANAANAWQFSALCWLGDDDVVRELVPQIKEWPGMGLHHHAVRGLDILAGIGTDLALRELHAISQKAKYKGLRKHAQAKVEQIAAARGLTGEQLGDRLVPDLGLDAGGTLVLDYGPRRFTAGFDEALKPYVVDGKGNLRASLPKPGVRDDDALAPAAYQRFAQLKKDVRAVAGMQLQRLERAMVTRRRWTVAEFGEFFVRHPLVWHIARRLVWLCEHGDAATAFRLAEDRTLADVDDDTFTPPEDAAITIAHPLHLGEELATWSQVFADYEIQQPFQQLGREVHLLTEAERTETELKRLHGLTAPTGKVIGMERHGWQRSTPENDGIQFRISRPVPGGRTAVVDLDPGIGIGSLDVSEEQRIRRVWVNDGARPAGHGDRGDPVRLSDLDPITVSEIINDLAFLTA